MKSPYISEIQPNQVVTATFLVQSKDIRQKKTGEPYLSLILGDRTGELDAKMWDNAGEVLDTFERDDYVRVRGLLQIYQNRPQFTVQKLQKVEEAEVDAADYFPASQRNPDEMLSDLKQIIAGFSNPHLKALLESLFSDEALCRAFKTAPAAKNIHHAYLGGLIEHVLSMCGLARLTAGHYKSIDLDLLLTGVILHDIGKTSELIYDRSFGYSDEGQLLGHILIGLRMVQEKVALIPGFPPRLRVLVEHLIASHHGELEYGSPKVPLFPEALLLHHLDNLDSKMECMRVLIEKDRHAESSWTAFSSALDRSVLKKQKYLDGPSAAPPAASSAPPPPKQNSQQPRPSSNNSLMADKLNAALKGGR